MNTFLFLGDNNYRMEYQGHQEPGAFDGLLGAPNDNFRKNICSEDDLRSRIF